jgi:hypothetical protein
MSNQNLELQQQPFSGILPQTIASAASIAPVTYVFFVSGTVALATIVPPVRAPHLLVAVFTNDAPAEFVTTGNISAAVTPVKNTALILSYEPRTGKYYPMVTGAAVINAPGGAEGDVQFQGASDDFDGDATLNFDGDNLTVPGGAGNALLVTADDLDDGAAAATGTLLNAPVAGNPTKWIPIDDNGTIRYIPTWEAA